VLLENAGERDGLIEVPTAVGPLDGGVQPSSPGESRRSPFQGRCMLALRPACAS
jgi:hypothetical protein